MSYHSAFACRTNDDTCSSVAELESRRMPYQPRQCCSLSKAVHLSSIVQSCCCVPVSDCPPWPSSPRTIDASPAHMQRSRRHSAAAQTVTIPSLIAMKSHRKLFPWFPFWIHAAVLMAELLLRCHQGERCRPPKELDWLVARSSGCIGVISADIYLVVFLAECTIGFLVFYRHCVCPVVSTQFIHQSPSDTRCRRVK